MTDFKFANDLSEWVMGKNSAKTWFQEQGYRSDLFYVVYGEKKNRGIRKFRMRFASFDEAREYGSQLVSAGRILSFQVCDE